MPAPESEAVSAAANLIASSRQPLITGLATDVAGVKAALALAKLSGGVVDHGNSDVLYRNIETLRQSGMFVASPAEMRRRADRFLIVGPNVPDDAPDLLGFLFGGTRDLGRPSADGEPRRIVWLGGAAGATLPSNGIALDPVPCDAEALTDAMGMIRAALGGRRFRAGSIATETAAVIAETLSKASFACIVWSAASLDAIGVEMAAGLVADLNAVTRASSIALSGGGHAWGAAQIATSVSGFPLRVGYGRGEAVHDAWGYDGKRLIASGECDLVVDVSALETLAPVDARRLPLIAITGHDEPPGGAKVAFQVGIPGRDHAGVLYSDHAASFITVDGVRGASDMPTADGILRAIAEALGSTAAKRAA